FIILLREGLEAILVVAAIIAYLIKTGNKSMTRYIYFGVAAGLAASGILAVVFNALFGGSGPQQEITEGVVALIAMLMLLYTSNWMLSR
ncbi:FTR1 family protein, partial [Pseudomonas aeruginosa]